MLLLGIFFNAFAEALKKLKYNVTLMKVCSEFHREKCQNKCRLKWYLLWNKKHIIFSLQESF